MKICLQWVNRKTFFFPWNGFFFKKSIYVYLGYKRWKGRSAMNTWNIQLCCWQSVTSRKRNNSTKSLCFCSILRSVYSSFYHSSYKNIFCWGFFKVSRWKSERLISKKKLYFYITCKSVENVLVLKKIEAQSRNNLKADTS